jgi:hypothetical protein
MAVRKGESAMLKKLLVSMIAIAVMVGFTSVTDQLKVQMDQMSQHYSKFDVKIGWTVTTGNNETTINGIIQNIRYNTMEGIEVWVSVLDTNGKVSVRSADYVIPNRLVKDDVAPFTIKLPIVATTNTKLLFTYKYIGSDGGTDGSVNWMQSFESTPGI